MIYSPIPVLSLLWMLTLNVALGLPVKDAVFFDSATSNAKNVELESRSPSGIPGPGSYAIYSPQKDFLPAEDDAGQYWIFVKFGDGGEGRVNDYCTYNPTYEGFERKAVLKPKERQGEIMEGKTLKKGEDADSTKIRALMHEKTRKRLEWYKISLGSDKTTAKTTRDLIVKQLESYKGISPKAQPHVHNEYANAFNQILNQHVLGPGRRIAALSVTPGSPESQSQSDSDSAPELIPASPGSPKAGSSSNLPPAPAAGSSGSNQPSGSKPKPGGRPPPTRVQPSRQNRENKSRR